jgi:hypothetical protein
MNVQNKNVLRLQDLVLLSEMKLNLRWCETICISMLNETLCNKFLQI